MVYFLIFLALAAICVLMLLPVALRINKYDFFKKRGKSGVIISFAVAFGIALIIGVIGGFTNAVVIMLHVSAFIGLCCLSGFVIKKTIKKTIAHHYLDIAAVLITVIYLFVGWLSMVNISRTEYALETEKNIGNDLRIIQVTDFHIGMILNGDKVSELVDDINAEKPDIVVITGDFVDDESEKEDMLASCRALGRLDAEKGIYFVWGNHDEGYFQSRNFSGEELRKALEKNGIIILEDEKALVAENICLIGRKDASDKERKSISELMKDISPDYYTIVLDHQPNDYDNESTAGADLVLSGHTHGGHMFPAGPIGVLIGANDEYYGLHTRKNTSFIVSSGVSAWEIPFKTGTHSEYVVIDINK